MARAGRSTSLGDAPGIRQVERGCLANGRSRQGEDQADRGKQVVRRQREYTVHLCPQAVLRVRSGRSSGRATLRKVSLSRNGGPNRRRSRGPSRLGPSNKPFRVIRPASTPSATKGFSPAGSRTDLGCSFHFSARSVRSTARRLMSVISSPPPDEDVEPRPMKLCLSSEHQCGRRNNLCRPIRGTPPQFWNGP